MIDQLIVIIYLLALMSTGVYYKIKGQDFQSFTKTSSITPGGFMMVATIFASSIGGGTSFGISEKVFSEDISYGIALGFAAVSDILVAIFVVPRLVTKYYGAETIGDIISKYYGPYGRYLSGFAAIAVSIGILSAQIGVSGYIFHYMLNVDYVFAVIGSYLIVIFYTTTGGFQSILFANQIQFFAIIVAIPLVFCFGIMELGLDNFLALIPKSKIDVFGTYEKNINLFSLFTGFVVMNLFPTFLQRALIHKDYRKTQKAIFIKTIVYIIFLIFITLNGLLAFVKFSHIDSRLVLPHLINDIIPWGIKGFVIVGFLAAVMSTADSDLNISAITLVKDIIRPAFNINDSKRLFRIVKIMNIIIGSLSIFIALSFTNIVDLVIFVSGFWVSVVLVPLIFTIFDYAIQTKYMIISSLFGLAAFSLWEFYFSDSSILKPLFVGFITNLIMFLLFRPQKRF